MDSYIDIVLEGEKFSPKKLKEKTNLNLKILAESGEIGKYGRYKGKPMPYGLAILNINSTTSKEINEELNSIADNLLAKKITLRNCGVKEITLEIENISANLDLKIENEILKKISKLNANVEFSPEEFDVLISRKREIEKFDLNQIINNLTHHKIFLTFDKEQKQRIYYIIEYKINNDKISDLKVSYTDFMTLFNMYILKYSQESDLNKIPDFEELLKELD